MDKALKDFKSLSSDKEFEIVYDTLFANKSVREKYMTINLFPKEIHLFSKYSEPGYTDDIRLEMRWQMKLFSVFSESINDFVKKKAIFDELILEEEYHKASQCLEEIEEQYGISFWLLENKILLFHKLDKNVKEMILNKLEMGFVSTVLGFFDMKASDEMLARDYDYFVRREISKFNRVNPDFDEVIDCYTFFIAPFLFKMTNTSINHVMKCICRFPLIDRYLAVLDIIEYYVSKMPEEEVPDWLRDEIQYLSEIEDSSVITYRFILSDGEDRLSGFSLNDNLIGLYNDYIQGDLNRCFEMVKAGVESRPADARLYNLYIDLCQLCSRSIEDLNVSENKKTLIINLNRIYSIEDEYNDSIDKVYKMCFWSFHASWARDIYNQITKHVQPIGSDEIAIGIKYSNLQQMTIDTVADNLEKNDALFYLENITIENGEDYLAYKIALLKEDYKKASEICRIRPLSDLLTLKGNDCFDDFEGYLKEDNPEVYKIECTKLLWDSMKSNEDYEKGIDYFIHLFIKREEYAIISPMDRFMEYASSCDLEARKNIRISILYYIYSTYFDSNYKDELSIACEDFFECNNIERPSEMKDECENYNKEQLVFFLGNICVPQIMGPVLLTVRTSSELEQERISICQKLRELDPKNEEAYDQEIKDTTHKLFLNDRVSTLETHKIQVNTDGIKARISKDLKSVFNKYMYARNSKLDVLLDKLKNMEGGEKLSLISLDSSQIFNEIVITIRNEFVSGAEYGLDAYLSLNIRHGTLTGQLRTPLINKELLAERDVETNDYNVSERWLYKYRDWFDRKKAKKAIIEFTEETDNIIEYLKKELIQISTEEKPTNGVFDYSLTDVQIKYLQNYLTENCELEDFVDNVFDELWRRTETNLEKMRANIRDNIKSRYNDAFKNLQNEYKNISVDFPEADQWIKEAQNDMDAELEKICDWFRRSSDGQYPDFDLDVAFQVGLQTIRNIHPSMRFNYSFVEKDLSEKIDGNAWKYFVSIFYILFDNISKYASEINGVKNIDCILKSDKCGFYIKMENQIDLRGHLDEAKKNVNSAMSLIADASYLARAKQEGGSGIPKIYKILAIDLKYKPTVQCMISEEKNVFQVEIGGKY